jgi:hypothetical protein
MPPSCYRDCAHCDVNQKVRDTPTRSPCVQSAPWNFRLPVCENLGWGDTGRARLANGILPFGWDTGGMIEGRTLAVLDQEALDAILEGAGKK